MARERKYTPGEDEIDFDAYAEKAPTSLQEHFAEWLIDNMQIEFPTQKAEAIFKNAVRLAVALRIPYQRSAENKEREADEQAANADARKEAQAASAEKKAARAAAKGEEEEVRAARPGRKSKAVAEPEPAPAKRGRPARKAPASKAAAATTAPATGERRRPARRTRPGAESKF